MQLSCLTASSQSRFFSSVVFPWKILQLSFITLAASQRLRITIIFFRHVNCQAETHLLCVVSFNAQRMHFWQKKILNELLFDSGVYFYMKAVEICKSRLINCHKSF
jgi:hypothetical protein